jgi:arylsulfatase A-like enzyme
MLKELDGYVERILQAIKKAGIWDDTIIIMTADHGGIKTGHGGKTLREMEIPFIISGKNVRKGMEIKESMMQYDTAAMIAYILGLKQPQSWIGRPVKTVFK